MSKYAKFKALLEGFLYDNVNKSHIATLFDEGAKTTIFSVSPKGSFRFSFSGGLSTWGKTYNNLESFYKYSEMLEDLEGLGYAFVNSCVSAEKSMKRGIPKTYYIKLVLFDIGDYSINVIIPEGSLYPN